MDNNRFDFDASRAAARAGEERAHAAATSDWKDAALHAVRRVCAKRQDFIVDDVWKVLDAWGLERPPEGRAMAGVLRKAHAEGLCEKTGQYRASSQVQCHSNPRMVWRAL